MSSQCAHNNVWLSQKPMLENHIEAHKSVLEFATIHVKQMCCSAPSTSTYFSKQPMAKFSRKIKPATTQSCLWQEAFDFMSLKKNIILHERGRRNACQKKVSLFLPHKSHTYVQIHQSIHLTNTISSALKRPFLNK